MFNSSSPLYIKPRLDMNLYKWLFAFAKSSTNKHVQKSIPLIKEATVLVKNSMMRLNKKMSLIFIMRKKVC